jgi:hypothetical protein
MARGRTTNPTMGPTSLWWALLRAHFGQVGLCLFQMLLSWVL